jgi:geranylgeranyl diphosphate synthase type I
MIASAGVPAAPCPAPSEPNMNALRDTITARLVAFLGDKQERAAAQGLVAEVPAVLGDFIAAGGKRIRPLLCVAGWHAAGGSPEVPDAVLRTAVALELYQAFALIHDDVIDNSASRRSQPTVHRALAQRYAHAADPAHLGVSAAILIGNMALTWSDELFTTAEVPAARRVAVGSLIDAMREEMHYGQYLDLLGALGPVEDQLTPMTVVRYKTAKYTVERPLHIGAALAGAPQALLDTLSRFALPLGDAFQLRDDLLGIYGDPDSTGKSVLDDLREGKHTLLVALAAQAADPAQRTLLDTHLGDPDLDEYDARRLREAITATGAPAVVETMIGDRYSEALAVLDDAPISDAATAMLRTLAALCVERRT